MNENLKKVLDDMVKTEGYQKYKQRYEQDKQRVVTKIKNHFVDTCKDLLKLLNKIINTEISDYYHNIVEEIDNVKDIKKITEYINHEEPVTRILKKILEYDYIKDFFYMGDEYYRLDLENIVSKSIMIEDVLHCCCCDYYECELEYNKAVIINEERENDIGNGISIKYTFTLIREDALKLYKENAKICVKALNNYLEELKLTEKEKEDGK